MILPNVLTTETDNGGRVPPCCIRYVHRLYVAIGGHYQIETNKTDVIAPAKTRVKVWL